ncbi:MAG: hypothetical protein WCG85_04035 [Polyangia bacterium]
MKKLPLTYREIAGILKVSEPRMCQFHTEAIGQSRKLLPDACGGGLGTSAGHGYKASSSRGSACSA